MYSLVVLYAMAAPPANCPECAAAGYSLAPPPAAAAYAPPPAVVVVAPARQPAPVVTATATVRVTASAGCSGGAATADRRGLFRGKSLRDRPRLFARLFGGCR